MDKIIGIIAFCFLLISCSNDREVLYQSDEFTVYEDGVTQGKNEARVITDKNIVSNYQSLAHENCSRLLKFKFSINEKDNERPAGADHLIVVGEEHESPIIKFGEDLATSPSDPGTKLPPNYAYTFKVDMNPVFEQFKAQGYYQSYDGSRVAENDFKAVYIAGGSYPLSWDFSNLEEKGLALTDVDGDGIYELTVILNPFDENNVNEKTWEASVDVSDKPSYHSDQRIVDALFNLSLEEARLNIEPDSTLRTGAKWDGVWTRDVSYSIFLAFAYHEPEVAKISLLRKVNDRKRIIQDTGSGGAWPVSSDRTTWTLAAWELYKVTGDTAWLNQAYEIIKNTLEDDYKSLKSDATGMFKGESSFLDWREQTYPKWMSNMDIYVSENLGTNVVHYQAYKILVHMAKILQKPYEEYEQRTNKIREGINKFLWLNEKGYYAQYLYGRDHLMVSPRFEALGEALAVLFDVADPERAETIVSSAPLTPFGATCIYPQIPDIPPYHNNGIWPFVQSYWNLAAAKVGNEEALNHGLASVYRSGALFLSNYENFVAESGDYVGTEINSHRMLWSMAGNLAMVHRVFMGMTFEPDQIRFAPVIPSAYTGKKSLKNFKYRDAVLDIDVIGTGNQIETFRVDGVKQNAFIIPASAKGNHYIQIIMKNNAMGGEINLVENKTSLATPQIAKEDKILTWKPVEKADSYIVLLNNQKYKQLPKDSHVLTIINPGEYAVVAVDDEGAESFASEPMLFLSNKSITKYEMESFAAKSDLPYSNYSGNGFVEIATDKNTSVVMQILCESTGKYLLDFAYSNGTGPWNTDNNCGIRSLYVNGVYEGIVVFPQRGTDEWSDWGFTNSKELHLERGKNSIELKFEDWNTNMDGKINKAMIDYMRVIKKK